MLNQIRLADVLLATVLFAKWVITFPAQATCRQPGRRAKFCTILLTPAVDMDLEAIWSPSSALGSTRSAAITAASFHVAYPHSSRRPPRRKCSASVFALALVRRAGLPRQFLTHASPRGQVICDDPGVQGTPVDACRMRFYSYRSSGEFQLDGQLIIRNYGRLERH